MSPTSIAGCSAGASRGSGARAATRAVGSSSAVASSNDAEPPAAGTSEFTCSGIDVALHPLQLWPADLDSRNLLHDRARGLHDAAARARRRQRVVDGLEPL